jgi:hypothetical protein
LKTTFSIEKTHFLSPFFFQNFLPEFNEDLPLKESLAKILPQFFRAIGRQNFAQLVLSTARRVGLRGGRGGPGGGRDWCS